MRSPYGWVDLRGLWRMVALELENDLRRWGIALIQMVEEINSHQKGVLKDFLFSVEATLSELDYIVFEPEEEELLDIDDI